MADIIFQKSLRRSTGEVSKIPTKEHRTRRTALKSVTEEVFDENVISVLPKRGPGDRFRRRLSTQGSVSEHDQQAPLSKENQKSPVKKGKALSFLKKIPAQLSLKPDADEAAAKKRIPSPLPLPPDVFNIYSEEDENSLYARDVFRYVCLRDPNYCPSLKDIFKDDSKTIYRREILTDWLISVAHYFKCAQETLYLTINLVDRCFAKQKFKEEHIQLLGITAFLIATKMDEYYSADIDKLCHLTQDSFYPQDVRSMELRILRLVDFQVYGTEPMTFIHRFLMAADRTNDVMALHLSTLCMDALMPLMKLWSEKTQLKAAASVFTALLLLKFKNEDNTNDLSFEEIWTPNLRYYAWHDHHELFPMSHYVLTMLKRILLDKNSKAYALTTKYLSQSRHHGLLSQGFLCIANVQTVLAFVETHEF